MMLAAAALMALTACSKDNEDNPIPEPIPEPAVEPVAESTVEWVDLGLPSGLLWAKCNIGASVPEESGDYFAWGETQAKEMYNWNAYRYCTADAEDNLTTLTKYNTMTDFGTVDNLTTLESCDDAATACIGNGARTPTKADWEEFLENTTAEWTTINGVIGCQFTAANGNCLFLPAAGGNYGLGIALAGTNGLYWTASLHTDEPDEAWGFRIVSTVPLQLVGYGDRKRGFCIRAVKAPAK